MDPFGDFDHFIAYFIPGFVLTILIIFVVSVLGSIDPVALFLTGSGIPNELFGAVIVSVILGLLVDGFRHSVEERWFEIPWSRKNPEIQWDEVEEDLPAYIPTISVDHYRLLRDENFYYYEFYINLALVLWLGAILVPVALLHADWVEYAYASIVVVAVLGILGRVCWNFGKEAYEWFLTSFFAALKRVSPTEECFRAQDSKG
jgi:hypothetical protein